MLDVTVGQFRVFKRPPNRGGETLVAFAGDFSECASNGIEATLAMEIERLREILRQHGINYIAQP